MNPNYFHVQVDASSPITQIKFQQNVGFQATSVKVGNYSCYWLYFPDADAFIPPFYIDYTLILKHTTDIQNYWLVAPSNISNPVAQTFVAPSYFFQLEFSDDPRITFAQGLPVNASSINVIVPPSTVFINNPSFDVIVTTTVIQVTNVATKLPTTNLPNRLSLLIQAAPDNLYTLYVGGSNVQANEIPGGNGGIQLLAGMSAPYDADDNVQLWGICQNGQTAIAIVTEGY